MAKHKRVTHTHKAKKVRAPRVAHTHKATGAHITRHGHVHHAAKWSA